ncbi:MAG: P1 family peptidase [Chloroflexi bacterium]|nr:P1 family peptidase [Chloroflexota bacterium]
MENNTLTAIPGIKVGHAQNETAITGCTVILCEKGAVAGVDQRGGAPGTRETDLLRPMHLVEKVHAIMLAGGSAFGLDAASGAMKFLEEKGVGVNIGVARVPIVPAAILLDLAIGDPSIRPDAQMGYAACQAASEKAVEQGNYGAGMGATVGKMLGQGQAMKSGIGSASIDLGNSLFVGALIAVNAFGDVVDPHTNQIIAGARTLKKGPVQVGKEDYFADSLFTMRTFAGKSILQIAGSQNTVIGVVATNAKLNKEEANKVAQMAHNGLARTIRPAHTMFDGDTIFCLATGKKNGDVNLIGAYAVEAVCQAIVNAVNYADPLGGLPSAKNRR